MVEENELRAQMAVLIRGDCMLKYLDKLDLVIIGNICSYLIIFCLVSSEHRYLSAGSAAFRISDYH